MSRLELPARVARELKSGGRIRRGRAHSYTNPTWSSIADETAAGVDRRSELVRREGRRHFRRMARAGALKHVKRERLRRKVNDAAVAVEFLDLVAAHLRTLDRAAGFGAAPLKVREALRQEDLDSLDVGARVTTKTIGEVLGL